MAELDNAFRVEDISIKDQFLLTGGDVNLTLDGLEAPIGSFYLTTVGSAFIKTGELNTEWAPVNINDEMVKVSATDPASGYLIDKLTSDHLSIGDNGSTLKLNLSASGVVPGVYTKILVDAFGRITTGYNPTTLAGYDITDAQPLNTTLSSIANNLTPGFLTLTSVGNVVSRLLTTTTLTITNDEGTAGNPVINLSTTGVTAGSYNNFSVDQYGRLTTARELNSGDITTALGYTPVNKAGDTMTGLLVLAGDPVDPLGAATKQYVDNNITGLDFKQAVHAATTWPIILSGLQNVDGVNLVVGDRVLVKNQLDATTNGIYTVSLLGWSRSADANSNAEVTSGLYCFVERGSTNASSGWVLATPDPITLGTTPLNFTQFSGLGQVEAGDGLTKVGSTINVVSASSTRIVVAADSIDLAAVGTPGTYNNVTTDAYGRVTSGSTLAYLLSNETITLSGDVTGSGSTAITATLASVGTPGTYTKVTTDSKGRVTAGTTLVASDIPDLPWSIITSGTPTTLAGYGITDAVANAGGAPSIQEGVFASIPAPGAVGRLYYATNLSTWFRDNGSAWELVQPEITGDVSIPAGSTTATLSAVGTPGTYNSVTTDSKGRVTSGSVEPYLTANQLITVSGDATGSGTTSIPLTLATVNASTGSFGNGTNVAQITVNAKGLITQVTNTPISFPVTSVNTRTGAITLTSSDVGLGNVVNSLQVINAGGTTSIQEGLLAGRPTAGSTGRLYITTDTFSVFRDNGSTWDLIQPALTGDITLNAGSTTTTLATVGTPGTYTKVTTDSKGRVISGASLALADITTALGYTPVNKAGDTMTGLLVLSGDPVDPLGAATKQYVDNLATGLDFKNSVRLATTVDITLSGVQAIDGLIANVGDRVLVKNQLDATTNGIYVVAPGTWARAADANVSAEVTTGMYCFVEEGGQAGQGWVLTTTMPITLGTTPLTFTQFSAGQSSFTVGGGLTYAGNVLLVATASTARIVVNPANIDLATIGTPGTYNNVTTDAYGRVTSGSTIPYLTTVTLTGDVTGSGSSSITATLANSGVVAGSGYNNFTVNSKGIITAASTIAYLTSNQTITITGDATGSGTTSIPLTLNTVPISKGGTGQTTQVAAFNALSPSTAKGDIIVNDGTNDVRLPIGIDGAVLIADSTQPTGVRWMPSVIPGSYRSMQVIVGPGIGPLSGTTIWASVGTTPPVSTEGTTIFSHTMTPSSVSSLILIKAAFTLAGSNRNMPIGLALFRDTTLVGTSFLATPSANSTGHPAMMHYRDSPGTTSPVTYTLKIAKMGGNGTWYVNSVPAGTWGNSMTSNTYTIEDFILN